MTFGRNQVMDVELVEAIFYKKINPGDLLNIDYSLHKGGGGQTYLDLAGIDQDELCSFLEYGSEIERNNPPVGDHRRKIGIYAVAIGTSITKLIEFDPRNNRPNYKLSDQRANRHPAWTPHFGFPTSPAGAKCAADVTNIPYLLVYLIRTSAKKYYAGFVNTPSMPINWPKGIGLERLFTGNRKGILFVNNHKIKFNNSAEYPFKILSQEDVDDLNAIPEDIADRANDAVEFIHRDIVVPDNREYSYVEQEPPKSAPIAPRQRKERYGQKVDYQRAQRNKTAIGRAGEKAVLAYEKKRLIDLGRPDLATRVEWTSETQGDGLGYDIHSFDIVNGVIQDRYLEVKTTTGAISKPFEVSKNEVEFSEEHPKEFILFRIFNFSVSENTIHFYKVSGSISKQFQLSATNYLAIKI